MGKRTCAPLVFAVLSVATLVPLLSAAGWPISHNGPLFALHTYIYARHFSWLDILPIWSSADVAGFGSPMPALYHKLFYVPAGLVALATGSLKGADAAVIVLFLVVGAMGMYRAMRELGASQSASVVAGCCLITANYTVTNWLVRGAVAEFSGAMAVPWVLLLFVQSIRAGRLLVGLGVALAIAWLGHSVLSYYLVLLLGTTYLALAVAGLAPWSVLRPQTAWRSLLCFGAIVAPFLLPMVVLGRPYDITRILTPPFQPADQFKLPIEYVWETYYRFGKTAAGMTVELDHAVVVLLVVSLCVLGLRRRAAGGAPRRQVLQPVAAFLIVALLGLVLQFGIAEPIYEWIPGAVFIQFPWRLLAIITPALIVAALYLADQTLPPDAKAFAFGAVAAWMVVACGAFAPLQDPRISFEPQLAGVTFSGFREYEPRDAVPLPEVRAAIAALWLEAGCAYDNLNPANEEVPIARFHTTCGRSAVLPLPLYSSPLHTVTSSQLPKSQPCISLPGFPSICGVAVPSGDGVISVRLPNMAALARRVWRAL